MFTSIKEQVKAQLEKQVRTRVLEPIVRRVEGGDEDLDALDRDRYPYEGLEAEGWFTLAEVVTVTTWKIEGLAAATVGRLEEFGDHCTQKRRAARMKHNGLR